MQEENRQEPAGNPDPVVEEPERVRLIDEDPFGPSYPESAIQYLPYRIGIIVFAVFMIILGKSNLVLLYAGSPQTRWTACRT